MVRFNGGSMYFGIIIPIGLFLVFNLAHQYLLGSRHDQVLPQIATSSYPSLVIVIDGPYCA